jgi:hypothetical protein
LSRVARLLALLASAASIAACATSSGPALDVGRFEANTYQNPSLGFEVVLPAGWMFVKPEPLERATRDMLAKQGEPSEATKQAMTRNHTLFGLVDLSHPPAPDEVPRSVTATVEVLDEQLAGMTSESYAAVTRMSIATHSPVESTFGQWRHQSIAGRDFVVLPTTVQSEGRRARQDYFVRVENSQALGLIVVYPEGSGVPQEALDAFQALPR